MRRYALQGDLVALDDFLDSEQPYDSASRITAATGDPALRIVWTDRGRR
jgi:hypothetical protein